MTNTEEASADLHTRWQTVVSVVGGEENWL
jgi:hypothetical protein